MAKRRKRPPAVCQSELRCRPYQAIPSGLARSTTVKTNSAKILPTETALLRATAMPIWVKNAITARKRVIHQSVLGSVRKNAIIVRKGYSPFSDARGQRTPAGHIGYPETTVSYRRSGRHDG